MSVGTVARQWLPPALMRRIDRAAGRGLRFEAGWSDWGAALAASGGYDDDAILERVRRATREVVAGRAAFERDGVTFAHWEPPFTILAPLLRHALRSDGRLDVVDFGGSLGSSYRQCQPLLPQLRALRWQVVEQPAFVRMGREEFSDAVLSFHDTLDSLAPAWPGAPRALLGSSVLQYLADPDAHLAAWRAAGTGTLVLDRTPVWDGPEHRACVQHVPESIYPGSYPCWILSRPRLLEAMGSGWRLVCEFDSAEGRYQAEHGPAFDFRGFVWDRVDG